MTSKQQKNRLANHHTMQPTPDDDAYNPIQRAKSSSFLNKSFALSLTSFLNLVKIFLNGFLPILLSWGRILPPPPPPLLLSSVSLVSLSLPLPPSLSFYLPFSSSFFSFLPSLLRNRRVFCVDGNPRRSSLASYTNQWRECTFGGYVDR
jgi:hypothetical protein